MSDSLPCPAEWRPNNIVSIGKAVRNVNTRSEDSYDFHKIPQRARNLRQTGEIGSSWKTTRIAFVGAARTCTCFSAWASKKKPGRLRRSRAGTDKMARLRPAQGRDKKAQSPEGPFATGPGSAFRSGLARHQSWKQVPSGSRSRTGECVEDDQSATGRRIQNCVWGVRECRNLELNSAPFFLNSTYARICFCELLENNLQVRDSPTASPCGLALGFAKRAHRRRRCSMPRRRLDPRESAAPRSVKQSGSRLNQLRRCVSRKSVWL